MMVKLYEFLLLRVIYFGH